MPTPISVTILTKNSAKYLHRVLEALTDFDEVLLLDNGSEDETLQLAVRFQNVRIEKSPFIGFGPLHNKASSLAKHDWILSIDSDEILSSQLNREIQSLKLNEDCVYSFERHTFYRGKLVKCCGWYPDRILRLYNRRKTRFSDDEVHEKILCDHLRVVKLQHPLQHFSYDSISDFLKKMQSYSDLYAKQWTGKKSSSPLKALFHSCSAFIVNYFFKNGLFCGYRGFLISSYQAHVTFYKYLKLYELNLKRVK